MNVSFMVKLPGRDFYLRDVDMPTVPRQGERVAVGKADAAYFVHSVAYILDPFTIIVYLRE